MQKQALSLAKSIIAEQQAMLAQPLVSCVQCGTDFRYKSVTHSFLSVLGKRRMEKDTVSFTKDEKYRTGTKLNGLAVMDNLFVVQAGIVTNITMTIRIVISMSGLVK